MKIIGMLPVYNEADIVENVIVYLLSQHIQLIIIDNGSTDGSYEICSRYVGNGVLRVRRLITEKYDFDLLMQALYDEALGFKADWVLVNAADEFLESPYPDCNLKEAIESEAKKGHNLIQFNNFEFWPTEMDEGKSEPDVRRRLKHYTWNDDLQFRCWKTVPGVAVAGTQGHYPIFPREVIVRIPKTKYVLRHYRVRSYEQGVRKVFVDRLPRYPPDEKAAGRHVHYDNFKPDRSHFVICSGNLNEYKDDGKWIVRKTFDWTWGVQGKAWAKPPRSRMAIRLANRFAFAVRIWKALFLRRKRLPPKQ